MTVQLFKEWIDDISNNEESARDFLELRRWDLSIKCPNCLSVERIAKRKGGYYRCNACRKDFTVRSGTIFRRSHIPLRKLVHFFYLLATSKKTIASTQLSKELGITQSSAWFLLKRFREAYGKGDITYIKQVDSDDDVLQKLNEIVGKVFSYDLKIKEK